MAPGPAPVPDRMDRLRRLHLEPPGFWEAPSPPPSQVLKTGSAPAPSQELKRCRENVPASDPAATLDPAYEYIWIVQFLNITAPESINLFMLCTFWHIAIYSSLVLKPWNRRLRSHSQSMISMNSDWQVCKASQRCQWTLRQIYICMTLRKFIF